MSEILFWGQFIASKVGKTGLTVTVDVDKYALAAGPLARESLVTAGAAAEDRNGLYVYKLEGAYLSSFQYVATFKTADATVDQQHVAAIGMVVPDALVSSRAAVEDIPTAAAVADAVHDEVVEGTLTLRQLLRLFLAVMAGKASGGSTTTIIFRDAGDTKARVTATVDANGNRTAITLDGT